MMQLDDRVARMGLNSLRQASQPLDMSILINAKLTRKTLPIALDKGGAGHRQSKSPFSSLYEPAVLILAQGPV
jgi:hypothetical protein